MEYMRIPKIQFLKIKEAAEESKNTKIIEIINEIEMQQLKKIIMRAYYKQYKITGETEYLKSYLELKNET